MTGSRLGVLVATCAVLASSACATFTEQPAAASWQPATPLTPQAAPKPDTGDSEGGAGGDADPGPNPDPTKIPPPDGCKDYNPAVLATCLDTVVAVAALPGDGSNPTALVGERKTGRVLLVRKDTAPTLFATIPVDPTGDGGLTGLALSPNYTEDQLVYAYVTTATDNRLVRIAPHDSPKPVLTGIPRGTTGNRGSLARDHVGALLLATGDAGNPTAAANPQSMAGKVLRLNAQGKAADGNPTAGDPILTSGLHSPGGICAAMDGAQMLVTDRLPAQDVLYRINPGKPLGTPAWTWPDRPGAAGCAATTKLVWVAMSTAGHVQNLPQAPDGSFTGKPQVVLAAPDGFGRIDGMDLMTESLAVAGTVNKGAPNAVSSDDRAIVIPVQPQGGAGSAD
ncbi:PQQ-dependent sugar dehydrogenase [Actinokineospora enzanensis]|uniref:PQQ-dependent sugar dehydrogenase n=1 Tax=Actinokineospora enzanensis TaxID=155975 RepID=UPI00037FC52A|nr:PQQ-dependent sugar dehydrogenase [Actinokineospora enzanensis]